MPLRWRSAEDLLQEYSEQEDKALHPVKDTHWKDMTEGQKHSQGAGSAVIQEILYNGQSKRPS